MVGMKSVGASSFLPTVALCIILQLTKGTRSEIQEGDTTQFMRSTKGGAKEVFRFGNEMFKQNMEIHSL
jgi:hypothetical protein